MNLARGVQTVTRDKRHRRNTLGADGEYESQLELEELHLRELLDARGTRYCHVIYDKRRESVIHVDGAIRILDPEEWNYRDTTHLMLAKSEPE